MKKIFLSVCLIMAVCLSSKANNLKIENIVFDQLAGTLSFDISWENSWNIDADYHDAVWIFAKYKTSNSNQWKPLVIDDGGGNVSSISGADLDFIPKRVGFIAKSSIVSASQKDIPATTVTISGLSVSGVNPSIKVFGTEMVYVPEGSFQAGDGSSADSRFVIGLTDPELIIPAVINENTTTVYIANFPFSTIDLNADFPTGYKSFYCMKYEVTQQQMVDYLNTLNRKQLSFFRKNESFKYFLNSSDVPLNRMGIAVKESSPIRNVVFGMDLNNNGVFDENDDGGSLACNYLNTSTLYAYLDWAALRPMSELEYEKAARGFDEPIEDDFAWGSTLFLSAVSDSTKNAGTPDEVNMTDRMNIASGFGPLRVGFASRESTDRIGSGNSYYGISNLSDNLSETVVEVLYRAFSRNAHGDGVHGEFVPWDIRQRIWKGGNYNMDGNVTISNRSYSGPLELLGGRGVISFE
ncbi:MAG: hypothetical protein AAFQ94_18140 [Bacteroidota bacterium]